MSDSDDDVKLPADTLAILNEYLAEQNHDQENWQMSQFWYDEATTEVLKNAVMGLTSNESKIGLLSCPTLMEPILQENVDVTLFEFDRRFEKFDTRFEFFDYNYPDDVNARFHGIFDVIVADPPFLSEECLTKFLNIIQLVKTESGKVILCTGAVLEEFLGKFGFSACGFIPEHKKKLGNEFRCYTNFVNGSKTDEDGAVVSAEELEHTAGRVQRVLNAFHEVTGVLSEVPRQIWMLPLRLGLLPGLKRTQEVIPNSTEFPCRNSSGEPATTVHKLRPQDIKVIASLGDSITSANGAMAYSEDETRLNYRGVSAMGGGQSNWRRFLTLPNILKEFSPRLQGYALGATDTSSPLAGYNLAENGALDDALLKQAKDLVRKIRHDPYVDWKLDWKLINILIGGNDICNEYCFVEDDKDAPLGHKKMLESALMYLKQRLPRTFVNLIHVPNILKLRNLKNVPFVCYAKHLVLCSCLFGGAEKTKAQSVEKILEGYWQVEREIANMTEFDTDDFTVVLQPFFLGVDTPENLNTIFGEAPNLNLFAPDCFHFSQRGHALIANALWNNMLEPVGNKTRGWEPIMNRFLCPTPEAPYFYTRRNSN